MKQALLLFAALMTCIPAGAGNLYQNNWNSIDSRPVPQWWTDAKFGIFVHWGVYSVPAWAPKGEYAQWYWHNYCPVSNEERLGEQVGSI